MLKIVSDCMDRLLILTILAIVVQSEILTPPYFNLAEKKRITATATCGFDTEGPELYCKLVGANAENDIDVNLIQGQVNSFLIKFICRNIKSVIMRIIRLLCKKKNVRALRTFSKN